MARHASPGIRSSTILMTHDPPLTTQALVDFKSQLRHSRENYPDSWEHSRRLVGRARLPTTLEQLLSAVQTASLDKPLQARLTSSLKDLTKDGLESRQSEGLKYLTGLPTTKALRALCVRFGIGEAPKPSPTTSNLSPKDIERFLHQQTNPYELLRQAKEPSLLDLGAGDLSFAMELSEQYVPVSSSPDRTLTLHCLERLKPGSKLGNLLHASHGALETLQTQTPGLRFRFCGDQDMFQLHQAKDLLPQYTIVTCHAPATPTFAYEPSRISKTLIDDHLRITKGTFQKIRHEGEPALEVYHRDRALIFPPWKFDIHGPLALLNLLAHRGQLVVMSAIDNEVFWEILSQLVEKESLRPRDLIFTKTTVPDVFGDLYKELMSLPIGQSQDLSTVTPLRQSFPPDHSGRERPLSTRFRAVHIRRGSVFEGVPASKTARFFKDMSEEVPPWMVILVPEPILEAPQTQIS